MIPTSIDGTDITGATIDGTDVQEITVDGDVVFSAGPDNLPLAFSNLIAWYPFDSATYGGSNTDDVTAIIGGSGDDTAYNLSNATGSPTHTTSGIATDINAGANSGAFDYDGSDDAHEANGIDINGLSEFTISFWIELDTTSGTFRRWVGNSIGFFNSGSVALRQREGDVQMVHNDAVFFGNASTNIEMWTMTSDISRAVIYKNGSSVGTINSSISNTSENDLYIGGYYTTTNSEYTDGTIDDVRIYNRELSASEVNQIYQNTQP